MIPLDTKLYLKLITSRRQFIQTLRDINSMRHQSNMETPLKAFRFDLCYRHPNVIISKENLNEKACKKVITFQHTFLRGINL